MLPDSVVSSLAELWQPLTVVVQRAPLVLSTVAVRLRGATVKRTSIDGTERTLPQLGTSATGIARQSRGSGLLSLMRPYGTRALWSLAQVALTNGFHPTHLTTSRVALQYA